jgi:hypothetical protein
VAKYEFIILPFIDLFEMRSHYVAQSVLKPFLSVLGIELRVGMHSTT